MPRWPQRTIEQRFWEKVQKQDSCWLWTGLQYQTGYGHFDMPVDGKWKARRAHIVAYELTVGPVPEGLDLDHLCRVRLCVNPEHLEPVTRRVNLLRGGTIPAMRAAQTHCVNGHEFTQENTAYWSNCRNCRTCNYLRGLRRSDAEQKNGNRVVER